MDVESGAFDEIGSGRQAILLPAISSISTRHEMDPLAACLGGSFFCIVQDWPGFGAESSACSDLTPDTLRRFLDDLCLTDIEAPAIGIAAGHGATYLVEAAGRHPGRFSHLVLIAPTWRGPLPTMLGGRHRSLCSGIRTALESPILGSLLFRVNVSRPVIRRMMREHVYADAAKVTGVLEAKLAITRRRGARFATAAFISGGLDPVASRPAFLDLFRGDLPPILLIWPENAPRRSGAEMEVLAQTGRVQIARVPGALAPHEEHPKAVAAAIRAFYQGSTA